MLPPRALLLPPQSHDDARLIDLMNTCAEHGLLTPSPLHIGLTPGAVSTHANLLWLIEASNLAQIASWAERLHAHHASAALILDDPKLLTHQELLALPGLGLWPVFTGGEVPLITRSPAEIRSVLDALPRPWPTKVLMPRPNKLHIATDALLSEELARHGIAHVFLPESQIIATEKRISTSRYRRVRLERDTPEQLIAWLRGDRLERARSGILALKDALFERR